MSSSPGDVQIHVYEEIPASLENMEGERIHRNNNVGDGTSTGTSEVTSVASVTTMASEETIVPFVPSRMFRAAKSVLDFCDDCGEKLAYFFGITSPKYEYEINAYNRMIKQEEERKKREIETFAGWRDPVEVTTQGQEQHPHAREVSPLMNPHGHPLPLNAMTLESDHRPGLTGV